MILLQNLLKMFYNERNFDKLPRLQKASGLLTPGFRAADEWRESPLSSNSFLVAEMAAMHTPAHPGTVVKTAPSLLECADT
jgi:hypothetical protein